MKLSEQYVPMSYAALEIGSRYGPAHFAVSPESHAKTIALLRANAFEDSGEPVWAGLMPSELMGQPRVMCMYLGRLNELAAVKCRWDIASIARPGEELMAVSTIVGKQIRRGLPFVTFETDTVSVDGTLVMRCVDELLLLHDVAKPFYKEAPMPLAEREWWYDRRRRMHVRWNWEDVLWRNNIHQDDYARSCGYERGLTELPTCIDYVFIPFAATFGERMVGSSIVVKRIRPIYRDDIIRVTAAGGGSTHEAIISRDGDIRMLTSILFENGLDRCVGSH